MRLGQILTAMKIETSVCELALSNRLPEEAARMAGLKKLRAGVELRESRLGKAAAELRAIEAKNR